MDSLIHDFSAALRYLRRNLGFSTTVAVILALGVAAATTVFSASEAVLFRPLPYPDGERLVSLRSISPMRDSLYERVAPGTLADWQLEASSFDAIAGFRWHTIDLVDGARSERLQGLFATPEFFGVFGVPLVGRSFSATDRGNRPIVLGHDLARRFDTNATAVGKTLALYVRNFSRPGPTQHVIVGLASAPVRFPPLTTDFQLGLATVLDTIDFWIPEFVTPTRPRDGHELDVIAKLRPGVTLAQAQVEMDAIVGRQAERYPESSRGWGVRVVPLREQIAGGSRTGLLFLTLSTWMLLLIATTNIATLVLARGIARDREIAVRAALGASRGRIVRQLLLEALILATLASGVALVLSFLAIELALAWLPESLPLLKEMRITAAVAGFAVLCAIAMACLTGIAPTIRFLREKRHSFLTRDGVGVTAGSWRRNLVRTFVSAEVALVLMLLLGAGLLGRSALQAWQVDPGFDARNLLTMTVSLPENKFAWNHNAVFARQVFQSVGVLPSVVGAAVIQGLPMGSGSFYGVGDIEGIVSRSDSEKPVWRIRVVSTNYFDVMGIPIVRGRGFQTNDEIGEVGYARDVIVSAAFANRYWPRGDPVGKRIGSPQRWETVVGVAGDVRYAGLETDPTIDVYYPQALFPQAAITLLTRMRGDSLTDVAEVRARIRSIDKDAFVTDVRSMEQVIAASQGERRAGTLLVMVFSGMALVLVLAGVYSVMAQSVVQRRRELAIRAAFGAEPGRLTVFAMSTAMLPAIAGVAGGLLGGFILTRVMRSLLYGVSSSDLATWLSACGVLLIACGAAAYLPARRALKIDPIAVLRTE